jgi:hypothetical protein
MAVSFSLSAIEHLRQLMKRRGSSTKAGVILSKRGNRPTHCGNEELADINLGNPRCLGLISAFRPSSTQHHRTRLQIGLSQSGELA